MVEQCIKARLSVNLHAICLTKPFKKLKNSKLFHQILEEDEEDALPHHGLGPTHPVVAPGRLRSSQRHVCVKRKQGTSGSDEPASQDPNSRGATYSPSVEYG